MGKVFLYGSPEGLGNYTAALESCGAKWVCSRDFHRAGDCSSLLLPGGGDMDPACYGQENTASRSIDPARDQAELRLIREFSRSGRPILGICRGIQVLNVAFGGDLVQELPTAALHRWEAATGDKSHPVTAGPGSFLRALYGERFAVNSAHHQGLGRLAPGLQVAARGEDGVIEAAAWPERDIYGLQFHPERMTGPHRRPGLPDGREVLAFFLSL